MSYSVFIPSKVLAEVLALSTAYEAQAEGRGKEFEAAVQLVFESLAQFPRMYPVVRGNRHRVLLARFQQHIVYVIKREQSVVIVSIRDAR